MAASATTTFSNIGLEPLYPKARTVSIQLYKSLTLARGTVLGELTPVNDVQTVTVNGSPGGGTFTLTVTIAGIAKTTTALAYNETAANVQIALRALTNVNGANVTATGSNGGPYTVTFIGTLAGQLITPITATYSALTGGTNPTVTIVHTTPGINAGTYAAYNDSNSDGTQVARLLLQFDCVTDATGLVTFGLQSGGGEHREASQMAPAYMAGSFATGDLTGLDTAAVTDLGRLIQGTVTAGILQMP